MAASTYTQYFAILAAILLMTTPCAVLSASSGLKLASNGYNDVLVQIEDDVSEHYCVQIFEGIEEVISRGSSVLYRATHRRAFFSEVTVVVPEHWTGSRCPRPLNSTYFPTFSPAISITKPHPIYGHIPWTLQVGGCGMQGHRIYMTPEYLADRNNTAYGDSGRLLVHEWSKFRWGVFEEYGHRGDPLYPSFYKEKAHSSHLTPTGCSNHPVSKLPSVCDPNLEDCPFLPDLDQNSDVTSSLLFLHYLPHVTQFCDETTHDRHAPTKHNALCGHKSVWEVIQKSPDFANGRNEPNIPTLDVTPRFTYVRPGPRRYVIVVENTSVMNLQKRWEFLRKAIRKLLVYDLATGHEVGVVLFNREARVQLPLEAVPNSLESRQRRATSSLPRNPSRIPQSQRSIIHGIRAAVEMLEAGGHAAEGGVVILIASATQLPSEELRQTVNFIQDRRIQVVPVIYPLTGRSPTPDNGIENLAYTSGTQSFAVLDAGIGSDSKVSMMVSLMQALYSALHIFLPSPRLLPLLIHQEEYPGGVSSMSEGSFVLDSTLGGQVRFCITYYDLSHVGNEIELIDPRGRPTDGTNQEEDGDVNMIFLTVSNAKPGRWRYRVENRADSHHSLYVHVLATPAQQTVTSFDGSEKDVTTLKAWTSVGPRSINASDVFSPTAIYAQLTCGMRPIVGAKVEAVIQRLGLNSTGSPCTPISFLLLDNGCGDADITKDDGVYSRYLPILDISPARYSLTVKASDNNERAFAITSANAMDISIAAKDSWSPNRQKRASVYGRGQPYCCGSAVPYSRTQAIGSLSRSVSVGILDIFINRDSLFMVPPSKVGDLRADVNPVTLEVTFIWTAPGDQYDHGNASHYEVRISKVKTNIGGNGEVIKDWPLPLSAGTLSKHAMRWMRHDAVYHVVLRAVGYSGQIALWSNVASFYVHPPPTTTEINTSGSTQAGTGSGNGDYGASHGALHSSLSTRHILAIIGAVCGLLLVVLIFVIYYVVAFTRRRKQKENKNKESTALPPSDTEPDADSISKNPEDGIIMTEAPDKRSLSPVQSWTASKLLAEHEKRKPAECSTEEFTYPYPPPGPFSYHTPNGHYIEDTIPIDGGSMVSSQPSESLLYKLDTSVADSMRPPSSAPTATPLSWEEINGRHGIGKIPPPTLPKPTLHKSHELSTSTLTSERRRRNVTQV